MHLLLLFLIYSIKTLASTCLPQPFAVPIKDVQVDPNIPDSFMIGISATIGTPEQNIVLAPWPDLNNTWIYDEQLYCDETVIFSDTICLVRRGHPFSETNSRSFAQFLDVTAAGGASQEIDAVGSEAGVTKLIDSSLGGTDSFSLDSSATVVKLPIGIPRLAWDAGYSTLHALGLGPNSTYLNALRNAGHISARVWSVFWGRMWTTDNPLDGTLVFGGYDRMKVLGQNHTQSLDYSSSGCWTGMKVTIQDIVINYRTGDDQPLFQANTVLPVCIVPQRQLLIEVPLGIYSNFETATATTKIGISSGLHLGAHLFDKDSAFDGDITIVLDSGLKIRVPNDQYTVPWVAIDRNGSRIFNESQREVLISVIDQQPATLGRYFLTAAYLMVDHESETFTLWQANPTKDSEFIPVEGKQPSTNCSTSADPSNPTSSSSSSSTDQSPKSASVGAIVGGVIGGLAVLTVTIVLATYLIKRKRGKSERPTSASNGPAMESGFKHELPGNAWQKTPLHSERYTDSSQLDSSESSEGKRWTRNVYEIG